MAKKSSTLKEILEIVIFFIVVGSLITTFVCYPLSRTKAMMARTDIETYVEDSLIVNELTVFEDSSIYICDTFTIEADGLTSVAVLSLTNPAADDTIKTKGSVILLHNDGGTRDDFKELATTFMNNNYSVILYDQRASGRSSGKYRGFGFYESSDLQEMISTLNIRGQITHPLLIVGYGLGADAALLAAREEKRIAAVAAVEPYITTDRYLDKLKDKYDAYWFPFYRSLMFWWYKIRSSNAPPYIELENVEGLACPTLLITSEPDDETITFLKDKSESNRLLLKNLSSKETIETAIFEYLSTQ